MENLGLLMEYEAVLTGNRKDFSSAYIGKNASDKNIHAVLRYAFENLLHWTPTMVRDYINMDIIQKLHLTKLVKKIYFPPELDREKDLSYIAHVLYPDQIPFSKRRRILQVYQKVLNGELKKYPKKFFLSADGELNANICLQYAINQRLRVHSIPALYEFFSDRTKAMHFLKTVRLHVPCSELYEYPVDMLHYSLPESQRDDLAYHFGKFNASFQATEKRRKKSEN